MSASESLFNYRTGDVARLLGMSKSKVLSRIKSGHLQYSDTTEGNQYIFRPKNIREYLTSLRNRKKIDTRILSFLNIKGGVGKSTLVIFISTIIRKMGFKVLVVDTDKQSNVTEFILGDKTPTAKMPHIKNIFRQDDLSLDGVIYQGRDGLDIIPSNISMARIENIALPNLSIFEEYVKVKLLNEYDYILIDNPTSINDYVKSGLIASDYIITPIVPARWSLDGLDFLEEIVRTLNRTSVMRREIMMLGTICNKFSVYRDPKNMKKNARALLDLKRSGDIPGEFETDIPDTTNYEQVIEDEQNILKSGIDPEYKKILFDLTFEIIERVHLFEKERKRGK